MQLTHTRTLVRICIANMLVRRRKSCSMLGGSRSVFDRACFTDFRLNGLGARLLERRSVYYLDP